MRLLAFLFFCAICVLSACGVRQGSEGSAAAAADAATVAEAERIVAALDDAQAAAQLLMTGIDGVSGLAPESRSLLAEVPVGAVMLFKYNLGQGEAAARRLSAELQEAVLAGAPASPPPFIAVDHEGGLVHRFGADATKLPAASAFGALMPTVRGPVIEEAAYRAALELRALGVSLNLAPVAEAADPEAAAFLGSRAYSADSGTVAAAAAAFVRGMRRGGVLCVVKHFPGNAATDPHRAAAVIRADGGRLDLMASLFARVIEGAAADAVMASHAVSEELDPARPSSLSPLVIDGLLRQRLGFSGMVVCDDLRMGAVVATGRNVGDAAVDAVAAGCDLIMTWPRDARALRDALLAAEASGRLRFGRIREAARRVVAAKLKAGMRPGEAFGPGPGNASELRVVTERVLAEAGLR